MTTLRRNVKTPERSGRDDISVVLARPGAVECGEAREERAVRDVEHALLRVDREHIHRLVAVLDLGKLRRGLAVGRHYAVRGVRPVASVRARPALLGDLRLGAESLVGVLPDEPALQVAVLVDRVPVVLQVAAAVARGVRVLADDERHVSVGALAVFH